MTYHKRTLLNLRGRHMSEDFSLTSTVTLNNGVEMERFGLGVWQAENGEATPAVAAAIKNGYRLIDTAKAYGNEADVRTGIEQGIAEAGISREDLFITTKLANPDHGYDSTLTNFEGSLERLGLDYVDLYLIHWPVTGKYKDTWKAMEKIYDQGLAKAIGVCNFNQETMEDLLTDANIVPAVDQIELHPLLQQPDMVQYADDHNIHLEAWSPLGGGKVLNNPVIGQIAAKYGKSAAQILIRWSLQMGFTVIPKSVHEQRIIENAQIFDFALTKEDMDLIATLDEHYRTSYWLTSFDWYTGDAK